MTDPTDEQWDMLENPTYLETYLLVGAGTNYASAIAKKLRKKQPTVTEQLKVLQRVRLVRPLEREKSQKFEVDWEPLIASFYMVVLDVLTHRDRADGGRLLSRVKEAKMENLLPGEFLKRFLVEYISVYLDVGGKSKGLQELIFSFFRGIGDVDRKEWNDLVRMFHLDGKLLSEVAFAVAIEVSITEQTALSDLALFNRDEAKEKGPG